MSDPKTTTTPEKKKTFTLSEEDIRTDRRGAGGSVGRVGAGPGGASKVIDPTGRGPGAPSDPDA
jgi:hypothetical protein